MGMKCWGLAIEPEVALLKNKQNKNQRFKSVLSHNKDGIYEYYLADRFFFFSKYILLKIFDSFMFYFAHDVIID